MPTDNQTMQPSPLRYIRCLIFDLGYTLWDRRRDKQAGEQAEAEANSLTGACLRQAGFSRWRVEEGDEQGGVAFRACFDDAEHEFIRRHPGLEPNGSELVGETLRRWGYESITQSVTMQIFRALQIHIAAPSFLFADTLPTLAALQARGYHLGVVTNRLWGGDSFLDDLRKLGLLRYIDPRAIAISADVGVRKPHPDLYLSSCIALGLSPTEVAMVGDSLRTDILGAQSLGMFTVWKPRARHWERINEYREQEEQAPTTLEDGARDDLDTDYLPASSQGRDGYLERYLRGEIKPDLLIEQVADLLNVFVDAQTPLVLK